MKTRIIEVSPQEITIVEVGIVGPMGPQGDEGPFGGATEIAALAVRVTSLEQSVQYVHTQNSANVTWTVVHGLNRYPVVSVVDSSGREVVGDVEHASLTQLIITFSSAFAGKAICT